MARQSTVLFVLALFVASFAFAAAARTGPMSTLDTAAHAAAAAARRLLQSPFAGRRDLSVDLQRMSAQYAVQAAADSWDPDVVHSVTAGTAARARAASYGYQYGMYGWRR